MRRRPWTSTRPLRTLFRPRISSVRRDGQRRRRTRAGFREPDSGSVPSEYISFVIWAWQTRSWRSLESTRVLLEFTNLLRSRVSPDSCGSRGFYRDGIRSICSSETRFSGKRIGFRLLHGYLLLCQRGDSRKSLFPDKEQFHGDRDLHDFCDAYHRICQLLQFYHFRLNFVRDFVEFAGIMLGATVALFFFGSVVHDITHITISA